MKASSLPYRICNDPNVGVNRSRFMSLLAAIALLCVNSVPAAVDPVTGNCGFASDDIYAKEFQCNRYGEFYTPPDPLPAGKPGDLIRRAFAAAADWPVIARLLEKASHNWPVGRTVGARPTAAAPCRSGCWPGGPGCRRRRVARQL